MDDHMKDSQKQNSLIYQFRLLEGNILALLLYPIIFSQGFQISIMKSFAPPPRLRVGLHDIPPTHPLYVLRPIQQIVAEFLCKMFKHALPILVSPPPPKSVPTRPTNVSHFTSKNQLYKSKEKLKLKLKLKY